MDHNLWKWYDHNLDSNIQKSTMTDCVYIDWTKLSWAPGFGFDLSNNIVVSVDYGHMASIYTIRIIQMRKQHDKIQK